jgi:hypothetical protein
MKSFQPSHRVLNRTVWSSLEGSRLLLQLLVHTLAPTGPLVMELDDTIERRRGAKIRAKRMDRDPVRSSHSHGVKASGLRWLSLMLLVPLPWAKQVWALPFLTVPAPSERYHQERGQRHQKLTDWACQMLLMVRRWVPERSLVLVTASSFAVITVLWWLSRLAPPICSITRLRLDAALYELAPPQQPRQHGRPRLKGRRLPTPAQVLANPATPWVTATVRGWYGARERVVHLVSATAVWYHAGMPALPIRWVLVRDPQEEFEPQALLCTDLMVAPLQILEWFVLRWRLEVTWQEARAYPQDAPKAVMDQLKRLDDQQLLNMAALMSAIGKEDERHTSTIHRPPIRGYDELTVDGVRGWLEGLNPEELEAMRSYEIAHKHRKALLRELDRRLK